MNVSAGAVYQTILDIEGSGYLAHALIAAPTAGGYSIKITIDSTVIFCGRSSATYKALGIANINMTYADNSNPPNVLANVKGALKSMEVLKQLPFNTDDTLNGCALIYAPILFEKNLKIEVKSVSTTDPVQYTVLGGTK